MDSNDKRKWLNVCDKMRLPTQDYDVVTTPLQTQEERTRKTASIRT